MAIHMHLVVLMLVVTCLAAGVHGQVPGSASGRALRGQPEVLLEAQMRAKPIRKALEAAFTAMPKNGGGLLDFEGSLYLLQRVLGQLNGWTLRGLELGDKTSMETGRGATGKMDTSLQDYLLSLEPQMKGDGLGLDGLTRLALALEDVARHQATATLKDIYQQLNVSKEQAARPEMERVIETYMIVYLGGQTWSVKQAIQSRQHWESHTGYWPSTVAWFRETEERHFADSEGPFTFNQVLRVAVELGALYGDFNQGSCKELKSALASSWGPGHTTGRVRLVDFYRLGMEDTTFACDEQESYLQALGALDTSNASFPMLIIPNYLNSQPNCLKATKLYSVCCKNECEALMTSLESNIAAPTAMPERIIELARQLKTDPAEVPPEFSPRLLARLEEMSKLHGGEVVLHGRLFGQWMHHAFPNECAYPHEAGTASPLSPDGWGGVDPAASLEERQRHIDEDTCGPEAAAEQWSGELPWSENEELFSSAVEADGLAKRVPAKRRLRVYALWVLFIALALFVGAVASPIQAARLQGWLRKTAPDILAKTILKSVVALFVLCMLNKVVALLSVCGFLVIRLLTSAGAKVGELPTKQCV